MRKKRVMAFGLAAVMAVSACFPASAASVVRGRWIKENGRWKCYDNEGKPYKNAMSVNNGFLFWLGEDGYLKTGHETGSTKTQIAGEDYWLKLGDNGRVKAVCYDSNGKPHYLYDLIQFSTNVRQNEWRKWDECHGEWEYYGQNGLPIGPGVQEIDGKLYYFDKDAEMKKWGLVEEYYCEPWEYNLVVDKWVPQDGNWSYFGSDGKRLKGKQEIDGVEYDFGSKGYISSEEALIPIVTSVELGEYSKTAHIGDVVEIPFSIEVTEMIASSSNAALSTSSNADEIIFEYGVEPDYSIFKKAYAVGNDNTFNIAKNDFDIKAKVSAKPSLNANRYEIDWDEQIIRIPIDTVGTVYGTFRIPTGKNDNKGESVSAESLFVMDTDGFVIKSYYPDDMTGEEQLADIFDQLSNKKISVDQALSTLRNMEPEKLYEAFLSNRDSQDMLKTIEIEYMKENEITTDIKIEDAVQSRLGISVTELVGLGLSAKKGTKATFQVRENKASLPEELQDKNTVAVDLKVVEAGKTMKKLDIPVVITMSKPKSIRNKSFDLYHIQDGGAEEVPYTYNEDDKTVTFVADSFSTYVFAEDKPKNQGSGGGSGSSSSGGGGSSSSKKVVTETYFDSRNIQGKWIQDAKGWWFLKEDGSYPKNEWIMNNNIWYHFDDQGYMQTGWLQLNNIYYYLNSNGAMVSNDWSLQDGKWYFFNIDGAMQTGWVSWKEKWYYLNPDGSMAVSIVTPDGYMINENGEWIE